MDVSLWVWLLTAVVLIAVLVGDLFILGRRPHEPSMKECGLAISAYVGLALIFGVGVWIFAGGEYAGEFYAGWLTEYSLSIDNLFIFVIIMGSFAVPRAYQQTALMVGIILALVMRAIFIAVGAAAINAFSWVFYLFGAILVYTAIQLARHRNDEEDDGENIVVRWAKAHLPVSEEFDGVHLTVRRAGKRLVTPMFIVIIALGSADLMFALDSIPAIFGLTQEPYLVFTANVFALMGLRQLYFLIGGLLKRLVYLSIGLSVILAFIGVKLVLHALHENALPFLNGGEPMHGVPEVSIAVSLGVIIGTLAITTVASLLKSRGVPDEPVEEETKGRL